MKRKGDPFFAEEEIRLRSKFICLAGIPPRYARQIAGLWLADEEGRGIRILERVTTRSVAPEEAMKLRERQVSREEFEEERRNRGFVVIGSEVGHVWGIPMEEVSSAMSERGGSLVLVNIRVGFRVMRSLFPFCLLVVTVPAEARAGGEIDLGKVIKNSEEEFGGAQEEEELPRETRLEWEALKEFSEEAHCIQVSRRQSELLQAYSQFRRLVSNYVGDM